MIRSTVTRLRSSAGLKVAAAGAAAAAAASFAMPAAECQSKDGAYVEIRSSIFVINGFYMAMREKYTKPSASIYYYLVEWDPAKLSWGDFREKVLGGTDPAMAADGSARKEIFAKWKALGLASEPNVGDNGMHASASPFEAMAERLNWVGAKLEEDAFGKAMLQAGIPRATIMEWTKDPQVAFEGKKQSLFDLLEDLDYADCLAKAQKIAGVSGSVPAGKSQAFVFVKPHAVTDPALSDGVVYNAVDACERLGVDGDQMDKLWANAKKSDNLVKFGGGFYAGKIPAPMPSPKKKKGLITRTSGDMSVFSSGESVLDAVFGPEGGKML
ncbi:hypothetical protein EMIHUDRAFT_471332 [Emiliania huxleyi CCMP1516]|uniref:Nucleoside-diphosphate kinase n=2 Tax=Emiliania huxleyi TaxID=2903 RepID=A0A0D3HXD8_EMIH1|nr:hypothetical protein EMIHUDRAFT_471332 [Emiliania huxleyi CCMP1516]EOD03673.1 hypothetical protein EMIHUDRAFT_471332 [Emiliania huxleyi CCMP1516]|eukprot:XP_005756102.1 hypothetical protein EMIHUDRAFT_471332 [Emiliania huxleyi CCMP1516]